MYKDTDLIIEGLRNSPAILENLVSEIPEEAACIRRIPGKWSIQEHIAHIADAQKMILGRFRKFLEEKNPEFVPFLPGNTSPDNHLAEIDITDALDLFRERRKKLLSLLQKYKVTTWENSGSHPEYIQFSPYIFLRHVLMHDHLHMYRIEELWLTNKGFLKGEPEASPSQKE